jgi:hypothetical protein
MATQFTDSTGRRWIDSASSLDISQMIAAEDDPKQRAFLIVLHSINQSLEANTSTVRDISDKLEGHLETYNAHTAEEQKLLNQGRGAWKIVAWVIGIAQVLATGAWIQQRNDMTLLTATTHSLLLADSEIKGRIDTLEKAVVSHIDATKK